MAAALCCALLACALAARAAPVPWYIESEFEPPRAYVGAEVTLRLRLLRAPGVPYGVLRPPRLGEDAELVPLGRTRAFETTRKGVVYDVREQTYAVVPRRAGKLLLPGPEIVGPLRQAAGPSRETRGAPRTLEVRAPRAAPGEPWLPARRVTIEEAWSQDPSALTAGQPVVRTLLVLAEGLTGNRLPALRMAEQPGLSVHHDASRFSSQYLEAGMTGRRLQRVVLIAQDEGEIELPELSLAWWDILADEPRVATLPARKLRIGAFAASRAAPAPAQAARAEMDPLEAMRWFAGLLFALSGLALWLYARRQPEREARKRLRAACRRNDAPGAREALAEWWQAAMKSTTAPLLARMGEAWSDDARTALMALDAALYAGRRWDGKACWRALRPCLRRRRAQREAAIPSSTLQALFRLQAPGRHVLDP